MSSHNVAMVFASAYFLIIYTFKFCCEAPEMFCITQRRFCENNPDPNYASCSQPQELTDEDIDKQLAGSEVGKGLP